MGAHRLSGQQCRCRQSQAAARDRRRVPGLLPRLDVARAVPAGPRRDTAHAAGIGDHQRDVDLRGRRWPSWRRLLGRKGRADVADDAHRVPVRPAGNPVQRGGAGRDADPDGRAAAGGRAVQEDQHRDDAAPAAGQDRRHRKHRRLPVLRRRRLHQRPDDRRRRWLEFHQVPVGLRPELGGWVAEYVEPVRPARPGRRSLRRPRRGVSR